MKLQKKECPYCKQTNYKILITRNAGDTVDTCRNAIYDPETDLNYENPTVKSEILKKIGNYCIFCTGD